MKRLTLQTLSTIAMTSILLVGCGQAPEKKEVADFSCRQDGILAPEFTCDPYMDGYIVGLGVAKMNAGHDKSMQRSEAMASGRDALARQIEVKVSNLFKSYKGTAGSGNASTFDKTTSDTSKQLASQTLSGSKQVGKSWRHPKTGELFIMVGIDSKKVKEKMDNSIKTSFKNDRAMYQKFLASQANGELDRELEKAKK